MSAASTTRELSPGDRRELRSLVKKQFNVLRNDVKRRKDELVAEIESELLRRYRDQDAQIEQAAREIAAAKRAYDDACIAIVKSLKANNPTLRAEMGYRGLVTEDARKVELHRALIASVPQQVADALVRLDQQELDLLRDLTIGALDTEAAKAFIDRIPTVGELVPAARLGELK